MEMPVQTQISVSTLTLADFLLKTNREKPEITGGCVLLTTATLTTSMILMALKISYKNADDPVQKRLLKQKIRAIFGSQQKIAEAADHDLAVFDAYRKILKSKSKSRAGKLTQSLNKATDSLLDVCKVIYKAINDTERSMPIVQATVLSDLEAGKLILEAVYKGILALAEGNIQSMPAEAQKLYDKRKTAEQDRLDV
jgi:formiminotetrahydrofolate cyclodeaminase